MIYVVYLALVVIVVVFLFKSRTTTVKRPQEGFHSPGRNAEPLMQKVIKMFFSPAIKGLNIQKKMEEQIFDASGEIKSELKNNEDQLQHLVDSLDKIERMGLVSPEFIRRVRSKL